MAEQTQIMTLVGEKLNEAAEKKGMTMRDISIAAGSTYEHVRQIMRGTSVPSKFMLRTLCDVLKLPFKEMEKLAQADRIRMKYGTVPLELSGKNPELEPIERAWPHLSDSHKKDLLTMVQAWADADKREARRG